MMTDVISDAELQEAKECAIRQFDQQSMQQTLQEITDEIADGMDTMQKEIVVQFYRCGACSWTSTAIDINDCTMNKYCKNRQQRRAYVPIEKTKFGDKRWYTCPCCGDNISRRNGWEDMGSFIPDLDKEVM